MDNQHKLIKGYRDLSEGEIKLINLVKECGEELAGIIESLNSTGTIDKRWVAIGETHLQQGIMALVRSITQPTTF